MAKNYLFPTYFIWSNGNLFIFKRGSILRTVFALRLALKITEPGHISKMGFESDAEKIKQTFYGASHFLCIKHIKDNVKEKIRNVNQVNLDKKNS